MNTLIINFKKGIIPIIFLLSCFPKYTSGQVVYSIDSLKQELAQTKTDTSKIRIRILLSKAYIDTNVVKALGYADEALDLSEKINWTEGKMLAELTIGDCYSHVMMYDKAIKHYNKSIAESRKINRKDIELRCLFQLSEVYNSAGNTVRNFEYKKLAIDLAHQLGDIKTEYVELNRFAGALEEIGSYNEAISNWQHALSIIKTTNFTHETTVALNNLSDGYLKINRPDSALYYLRNAITLASQTKDTAAIIFIFTTFSEVYDILKNFDSARYYGEQALNMARLTKDIDFQQYNYKSLSRIYEFNHQPLRALEYYKKYDSVFNLVKNEQKTIYNAKQVMKIDFDQQARIYRLEKASFESIKQHQQIVLVATILSLVAYIFIVIFIYMIREIKHQKQNEVEKTKMIADITKRNKDLEQFSYIISHNFRSPVSNIIGLIDLLQSPGNSTEDHKFMMTEINNSIHKLDAVIKDLNSILQMKNAINEMNEVVKFSEILDDIKISIELLLKKEGIEIISNFNEVNEIHTIKTYLYSIFFNLISNSIKYRRHGIKPVIEITSIKSGSNIILIFKDNGLGIDIHKKGKEVFGLYKRFHFHTEGKGMGLFMVKTQVEALNGTISINSEVNNGTTFTIEINK